MLFAYAPVQNDAKRELKYCGRNEVTSIIGTDNECDKCNGKNINI